MSCDHYNPISGTAIKFTRYKEKPMNQSEQLNELATALSKCQGQMEPAIKDSTNPHFKSKFATLYSIWEACRKPLADNGLSVVQMIEYINGEQFLVTKLMHSSGQWLSSITKVVSARQDAQGIGSALSYFKRYSLSALLGVCTADEDDDAESAMPKDRASAKTPKADSPYITKEQLTELNVLSDECEPEYMASVYSYLETMNIKTWDKIKQDLYPRVVEGMKKNISKKAGVVHV